MLFKLRSLSKLVCIAALGLFFLAADSAQTESAPPVPIWSGQGSIPKGHADRRVFLSPDEHSVIILWPNQDNTESKRLRLPLHNVIYPNVRVQIETHSGGFLYTYKLENREQSDDSITNFSVVIYPDPDIQLRAELWTPVKALSTVKERMGIPGAPPGRLALWLCPDAQSLLPGKATTFGLISEARPGFTTAATEHYPHLDLTDKWPEQILDELEPVLTPSWIDQYVITLGPRYGRDEAAAKIASDYITGIQELVHQTRLAGNSVFVREVLSGLQAIVGGTSSGPLVLRQKPESQLENEILRALHLSLHAAYSFQRRAQ